MFASHIFRLERAQKEKDERKRLPKENKTPQKKRKTRRSKTSQKSFVCLFRWPRRGHVMNVPASDRPQTTWATGTNPPPPHRVNDFTSRASGSLHAAALEVHWVVERIEGRSAYGIDHGRDPQPGFLTPPCRGAVFRGALRPPTAEANTDGVLLQISAGAPSMLISIACVTWGWMRSHEKALGEQTRLPGTGSSMG